MKIKKYITMAIIQICLIATLVMAEQPGTVYITLYCCQGGGCATQYGGDSGATNGRCYENCEQQTCVCDQYFPGSGWTNNQYSACHAG